jgi:hypothetical protein
MDELDSFHAMITTEWMRSHDSTLVRMEIPDNNGMQLLMEGLSTQMSRESADEVGVDDSLGYIRQHTPGPQFTNTCTTTIPLRRGILESRGDDLNIQSEALFDQGSLLVDIGFDQSFNKSGPFSSAIFARHVGERSGSMHGMYEAQNAFQSSPLHSKGYKEARLLTPFSGDSTAVSENARVKCLPGKTWPTVPQIFNQCIRDALLAIVAREERSREIFPSFAKFPSAISMDILADRFLRKQNRKLDCWIHTATFDPATAPADLTFMILAAGALGTQTSNLRQWGHQMCRFMKRRLSVKVRTLRISVCPQQILTEYY